MKWWLVVSGFLWIMFRIHKNISPHFLSADDPLIEASTHWGAYYHHLVIVFSMEPNDGWLSIKYLLTTHDKPGQQHSQYLPAPQFQRWVERVRERVTNCTKKITLYLGRAFKNILIEIFITRRPLLSQSQIIFYIFILGSWLRADSRNPAKLIQSYYVGLSKLKCMTRLMC